MTVQFRNEKVSNHGSKPITLTVTVWPSSFLKKYGPMIPPAHKAQQTICLLLLCFHTSPQEVRRGKISADRSITGLRNSCPNDSVLFKADFRPSAIESLKELMSGEVL
ncbi:hypothetical protein TNCV_3041031 [Trichonephila clavipes]|nr:hypothetical protein TNCV_3041031 [Trichonephila clavipes]